MSRSAAVALAILAFIPASPSLAEAQFPGVADAALPQVDTFQMLVNGQPVGTQVMTLQAGKEGGYILRETTSWAGGRQSTEVRLDGALHVRSVRQEGRVGDQDTRIDVRYEGGRVSGSARVVAGASQPVDVTVDAEVPPNVVDDNALLGLVSMLPWRDGAEFELPVFSAGKNQLVVHRLRVTGTEVVSVPAGSVAAYRVDITGIRPLVLHVSTRTGRVVRLQVSGTPMEMVRGGPPLP